MSTNSNVVGTCKEGRRGAGAGRQRRPRARWPPRSHRAYHGRGVLVPAWRRCALAPGSTHVHALLFPCWPFSPPLAATCTPAARRHALTSSLDLLMLESTLRRSSGTVTMPVLGSMVQKGKLAACAFPFSTMALNRVDCALSVAKHHERYVCFGIRRQRWLWLRALALARSWPPHVAASPCRRWAGPQCLLGGPHKPCLPCVRLVFHRESGVSVRLARGSGLQVDRGRWRPLSARRRHLNPRRPCGAATPNGAHADPASRLATVRSIACPVVPLPAECAC